MAAVSSKMLSLDQVARERDRLRAEGKLVVLTNGHFELLHPGHVRYLKQARMLGDTLIVAVNDDQSTRQLKGRGRPVVPQADRAEVLAALECVDYVVVFAGTSAVDVVSAVRPDVYVKGGDYAVETGKELPETAAVHAAGGHVVILPFASGYSTSALIREIVNRFCPSSTP